MATNRTYTDNEILAIASRQKAIIWLILLSIPAHAAAIEYPYISIILALFSLVFIYRLAAALKEPAPWGFAALGMMWCIGLIVLLLVSTRATSAIKARGVRVGLMGARRDDLAKIMTTAA